jgi:uncharacterized glyoxalase superfamily protein PhnB
MGSPDHEASVRAVQAQRRSLIRWPISCQVVTIETRSHDRFDLMMTVRTSGIRQPSVWASVVSDDALGLRDWLLGVGFSEDLMIPGEEDGRIHHCQMDWPEGGRVLLSSTGERSTPCLPGTSSLHVVTSDPDAVMHRAHKLGATIVHPLVDQTDYPSRDFTVADPDGNHWTFATFAG